MSEEEVISVYTDGSCMKKIQTASTGYGGWGYCVLAKDIVFYDAGSLHDTTNNRMELLAVIKSLEFCSGLYKNILIHTDSIYVLNCATGKYKRHTNIDLWSRYDELTTNFSQINWKKVKGHSGDKWNDYVDKIARVETEKIKNIVTQ